MTDPLGRVRRVPAHIAVMLGLSTAAYAVSLAAVAMDESRAEATVAAARLPALDVIDALARDNGVLDAAIGRADGDLTSAAAAYGTAGSQLSAFEAALAGLAGTVAEIDGVSRTLPASIPLPAVSKTSRTSVPTTHVTTGASGG